MFLITSPEGIVRAVWPEGRLGFAVYTLQLQPGALKSGVADANAARSTTEEILENMLRKDDNEFDNDSDNQEGGRGQSGKLNPGCPLYRTTTCET